jgi:hypothetical protein
MIEIPDTCEGKDCFLTLSDKPAILYKNHNRRACMKGIENFSLCEFLESSQAHTTMVKNDEQLWN